MFKLQSVMRRAHSSLASLTKPIACAVLVLAALSVPVSAQQPVGADAPAGFYWREMLEADLTFVRTTLEQRYIYAIYPDEGAWFRSVDELAAREAAEAAPNVATFAAYRATLTRFVNAFSDPHLRLTWGLQPARVEWPRFTTRYRAGRVVVGVSQVEGVSPGAELTSCDGRPAVEMADALARLEGGVAGTESARAEFAPLITTDVQNPFFERPVRCVIGGAEIDLRWSQIGAAALGELTPTQIDDVPPGLSAFGADGAWIRMPTMSPDPTSDIAAAYRSVIEEGPSLRDKRVIVFDVRGNSGGAYNWYMAILRSVYGGDYVSYYGRARLEIRPVFVFEALPAVSDLQQLRTTMAGPIDMPADADLDAVVSHIHQIELPGGRRVTAMDPADERLRARPPGAPPHNAVRARVYVLTDFGCKSACIGFLDEIRNFSNVEQIGSESGTDMRSGSSAPYRLPSGNAVLRVPTMLRENRSRGENEQYPIARRFDGEITDTPSVRVWIRQLLREDAAVRPARRQ